MGLVSLLFSFKGRINRAQYWLGCIGAGVGGVMLLFLLGTLFLPSGEIPKSSAGVAQVVSTLGLVMGVPLMLIGWVGMALQTKRFHDRGRSGLWTLLPFLPVMMIVTNIMTGIGTGASPEQVVSSLGMWFLLLQGINLFTFVDLGCMPGKEGPNKYGNPPGSPPSPSATPGSPAKGAPAIPGMGQSQALVGVESAIDRAIAARARQMQAQAQPQRAHAAPAPSVGLRPSTLGSFGRKVAQ